MAYNQAMASCSWEQAWACFHTMRRAGLQPNTRSYNAVSTHSFHSSCDTADASPRVPCCLHVSNRYTKADGPLCQSALESGPTSACALCSCWRPVKGTARPTELSRPLPAWSARRQVAKLTQS